MTTQPVETRILPEPDERTPLTYEHVISQFVQNCLGGLGIGAALAAVLWRAGMPAADNWPWAMCVGIVAAGLATAARAWADEMRDVRVRAKWEAAIGDLTEQAEEGDEIIALLRDELRIERAENSKLRWQADQLRSTINTRWHSASPPDAAESPDARTMLEWRYNTGRHPSRAMLRAQGWTDARYTAAATTLQAAGVLDLSDPQHPRWVHDDAQKAAAVLAHYTQSEAD